MAKEDENDLKQKKEKKKSAPGTGKGTKGTKIEDSIFIFGAEDGRWICPTKKDAMANMKNYLKSGNYKIKDLSVLELKKTEEKEWKISEIGLGEIMEYIYSKK